MIVEVAGSEGGRVVAVVVNLARRDVEVKDEEVREDGQYAAHDEAPGLEGGDVVEQGKLVLHGGG